MERENELLQYLNTLGVCNHVSELIGSRSATSRHVTHSREQLTLRKMKKNSPVVDLLSERHFQMAFSYVCRIVPVNKELFEHDIRFKLDSISSWLPCV
eukprot:sb/3478898/